MARAYSLDLRERVVAAVIAGRSCRAAASMFGVSVASVVKWLQRLRATGNAAAKPAGRQQPRSLCAERDWLMARLAAVPDMTLRALVAELCERARPNCGRDPSALAPCRRQMTPLLDQAEHAVDFAEHLHEP